MKSFLTGAYDLHLHPAPDVVERKCNDIEIARDAVSYGMRGFVIKSHYFNTAGRAALVRHVVPECNAIGAMVLNNAIGGLNPAAVEMGARAGTKFVWFPTMDAQNMWDFLARTGAPVPFGSAHSDAGTVTGITLLADGKLKPEVYEILDLIKQFDLVLATGHISVQESLSLLKAAREKKIERLIATHVEFPPTLASVEQQREYVKYGAFVEHNYLTILNNDYTIEDLKHQIKEVGVEHVVLSSDLGQQMNPAPAAGFENMVRLLLNASVPEADIRRMIAENTARLVE